MVAVLVQALGDACATVGACSMLAGLTWTICFLAQDHYENYGQMSFDNTLLGVEGALFAGRDAFLDLFSQSWFAYSNAENDEETFYVGTGAELMKSGH
eukprot:116968-Amphidinium_carterae.1